MYICMYHFDFSLNIGLFLFLNILLLRLRFQSYESLRRERYYFTMLGFDNLLRSNRTRKTADILLIGSKLHTLYKLFNET